MSVNLSDLLPSKQYPQLSPFLGLLPVSRIEGSEALYQVIPLASFYQMNPNPTLTLNNPSLFLPDMGEPPLALKLRG